MQDNILAIDNVYTQNLNNFSYTVIVPTLASQGSKQLVIRYKIVNINSSNVVDTDSINLSPHLTVSLIDSRTGFRYPLDTIFQSFDSSSGLNNLVCNVDFRSITDNRNIGFLEVKYIDPDGNPLADRTEVTVKYMKGLSTNLSYVVGTQVSRQSNLLLNRSKIAMPAWSTVSKNVISNYLKVVEPLHDGFETAMAKTSDALRMSFDDNYDYQNFAKIALAERPLSISQLRDGVFKDIPESTCIQRSEFDIIVNSFNLPNNPSWDGSLLKIFFNPLDDFNTDILNSVLPSKLYLKKVDTQGAKFTECVIYGIDMNNNLITESVNIRHSHPTETFNVFKKITKISSRFVVEISNFVDLSTTFYVDKNSYISAPVVNESFNLFTPSISTITNTNYDTIQLVMRDESNYTSDYLYKFDFNTDNISSIYVRQDMSVIWITNTSVNIGRLSIDVSKETSNNTTTNNNDFITVSDNNPAIGDWIDVTINVVDWFTKTDDSSMMIQCSNNGNTSYYDFDSQSITSDYCHIYRELALSPQIQFEVLVENDQPYIFNIVPYTNTNRMLSAMSVVNKVYIDNTYSTDLESGHTLSLYLIDGQLVTLQDRNIGINTSTDNIEFDSGYDVAILLDWTGAPRLDYLIKVGNESVGYNNTTMTEPNVKEAFNIATGGPNLIYLSTAQLKVATSFTGDLVFQIGTGWFKDSYLPNNLSQAELYIFTKNGRYLKLQLNPEQQADGVSTIEYTITIPELGTSPITSI